MKVNFKRSVKELFHLGAEPDFLVLGAQKAGTTSLFKYISLYCKNFVPPVRKEIQYFSENYHKGMNYYRSFFPLGLGDNLTGEASPTYLFYRKVPERLLESGLSDLKFVVILRDPVDRAFSHYNFLNFTDRTSGKDPKAFLDALKSEELRVNVDADDFTYSNKKFSYKSRGLYFDQLTHWFSYFDRNKFFILELQEFEKDPKRHLEELFEFLGAEPNDEFYKAEFKKYNQNKVGDMPVDAERYLVEFFREPNEKLFQLLGRRFSWK